MKKFEDLLGKTIVKIEGMKKGSEKVTLTLQNGDIVSLYHFQDCCEYVSLYDVNGHIEDLIGSPVTMALESSSGKYPADIEAPKYTDSYTWTFYKLATINGFVDMRWLGESNGYYSEVVDFKFHTKENSNDRFKKQPRGSLERRV